ncbi:hypothetical protein [Oleiagrimonas sp.]|jgi:hypothetical protein|uniref:hypothetical protein n=1 Tax=Oleiagrimonas sp. TaxID=2010330 RepID=UPI00261678C1|nr:hypothetical protein [Oleiagrimonas sp.]MDA3913052.1 hypothetical protein [Oleiagrimonas sp.]
MDTFGIIGLTFGRSALFFSLKNHERINTLEKKLKDLNLIPSASSSEPKPGKLEASDG